MPVAYHEPMPACRDPGPTLATRAGLASGVVTCEPFGHADGLDEAVARIPRHPVPGTVYVDAERPTGRGVRATSDGAASGAA